MSIPRFGAFLFAAQFAGLGEGEVLQAALSYADTAEATGFDDLWVTEHHSITYGVNPSALTFAAHLLGRTSRARVGTAVTLLPHASPVFVAEQAALLDQLSGGRFDLGIGRGGPVSDLLVAGRHFEHWARGYWPAVDLLRQSWTGKVAADDELYAFPEIVVKPQPSNPAGPPLLIASASEASVEQAARRGIPLLLFLNETDESRRRAVDRWAEVAAAHGHPTDDPGHACALLGHVAEPGESAATVGDNVYQLFCDSTSQYVLLPEAADAPGPQLHTPEQLRTYVDSMLATHPVGSPRECAERLVERMRNSGVRRVLLLLEGAREPARVRRTITAFGEQVLPEVRRALG